MAKKNFSPSFIYEIPLQPENWQKDIILHKLDSGRQIFNACLQEALSRRTQMITSKEYIKTSKAYKIAKKAKDEDNILILKENFNKLIKLYNFTDYSLQSFAINFKNIQFKNILDSHSTQKLASRSFKSVSEYHFRNRGRPRYKTFGQLKSLEGKNNDTSIRFLNDKMSWGKLKVPVNLKPEHLDTYDRECLSRRIKFCRIVVKDIREKQRFFLQLILEGIPPQKEKFLERRAENFGKKVGLDLGPQSLAYVAESEARLLVLAEGIEKIKKEKKELQRIMGRKLRKSNPQNFQPTTYKGKKKKLGKMKPKKELTKLVKTNNYKKVKNQVKEISRKEQDFRKTSHNALINSLLLLGSEFYLEKIYYVAWQKMFKSVANRSPGLFVESLRRKVANTGGHTYECLTQTTALSQTCLCGKKVKKPLGQRWHSCECGVNAQRDLFSAYLAIYVNEDSKLDIERAKSSFTGVEHSLESAIQNLLYGASPSSLKVLGLRKSEIELRAEIMSKKKSIVNFEEASLKEEALEKNLIESTFRTFAIHGVVV